MNFPHLYECSVCGEPVKVKPQGEGLEPLKQFSCQHVDATIWANRKVTLRGVGSMNAAQEATLKVTMTVRQFLSAITGRSI
jgi:endogenous inhibitor of DNA gyrase (YacG/DUF329 family)